MIQVNSAIDRASRAQRRTFCPEDAAIFDLTTIDLERRRLVFTSSDDVLRRRWERIALGQRS